MKLALIIILLVGNVIYWGTQKEGFHLDEMLSYEQVGNTDYPKPQYDRPGEPCMDTWHGREYYEDYLVVSPDEAFDIIAFYWSASRNGSHPPLYLVLFGLFISAVSQNHFTKWSGLALNIVFFVLSLIIVYDISKRLLKKEKLALLTVFLSGVSVGMVSISMFIRPYMLLTLFIVAFSDIHVRLLEQDRQSKSSSKERVSLYIALALVFIGGALSHYYFLIFAFFLCLVYWLSLLLAKERRSLIRYTLIITGSFCVYLCMWNNFLRDFFLEKRGREAFHNFLWAVGDYVSVVTNFIRQINLQTMGGYFIRLFVVLVVAVIIKKFWIWSVSDVSTAKDENQKERKGKLITVDWLMFGLLSFSILCFLLLIARVAPSYHPLMKEDRYIACAFPLCTLLEVFLINKLSRHFFVVSRILIWSAVVFLTLLGYITSGVKYLYPGATDQLDQLKLHYYNDRAVFVSEVDYLGSVLNVYFTNHEAVYQTDFAGIPKIADALEDYENDTLVLYISQDENVEDVIALLSEDLDVTECDHLFQTSGNDKTDVYIMKLRR